MSCVFCEVKSQSDQEILFENSLVLFTRNPTKQGSLKHSGVLIPIRHCETVFDLTEKEWKATFTMLNEVKAWMDAQYQPQGYNVGWNCGKVGGQEVFHAHMHVIPRFAQEPLAGKGIRSLLKSEANRW